MPVASQKSAIAPSAEGMLVAHRPARIKNHIQYRRMPLAARHDDVGSFCATPRGSHERSFGGRNAFEPALHGDLPWRAYRFRAALGHSVGTSPHRYRGRASCRSLPPSPCPSPPDRAWRASSSPARRRRRETSPARISHQERRPSWQTSGWPRTCSTVTTIPSQTCVRDGVDLPLRRISRTISSADCRERPACRARQLGSLPRPRHAAACH